MAKPKLLYTQLLAAGTLGASTTAAGYAVASLADLRTYTWWKPTAMPATVTVDCGSAKAADMLAVFGHDLGSKAATIEVRGSTDNFVGSDVLVASKAPTSDEPFILMFGSVSYRYWRLRITGAAVPAMACPILGPALEMPCGMESGFDPTGRVAVGRGVDNNNGEPLGSLVDFERWQAELEFRLLPWAWVRSTWLPAWKAGLRSQPFAFCWDPGNYPDEVRLVKTEGEFETPHSSGSLCDLVVTVKGRA